MRPDRRFWTRAVGISAGLFFVWWMLVTRGATPYLVQDGAFLIPVVAVMIASTVPIRSKLIAVGVLVAVFALGDTVAYLMGVRETARTGVVYANSLGSRLGGAAYHAFRVGVPVAGLLLFTGLPSLAGRKPRSERTA
jgi:hypothetical protein